MTLRTHRLLWTALSLAAATGCSVINRLEPCGQPAPVSHEANVRTEGSQAVDGVDPLAPLPDRGAFVVFTSAVSGDDDGTGPAAIRGGVLDGAGQLQRTCGEDGEAEYEPAGGAGTRADQPSVAMPLAPDTDIGLVVWRAVSGAGQGVRGRFVRRTGCALGAAFDVSTGPAPRVERPSVAVLGTGRFVVAWTTVPEVAPQGRARVVENQISFTPTFVPTDPAPDGAPADLVTRGNGETYLRVRATSDGRFLAAWFDAVTRDAWFGTFDDRLAAVSAPRLASDRPPRTGAPAGLPGVSYAAFASDGAQTLGVWTEATDEGARRLRARFFSPEQEPLRAPTAPQGGTFALNDLSAVDEGAVAVVPMAGGGFFAAWEDSPLAADATRLLRGVVFGPGGARRFSPLACDATGFDPTPGVSGTRRAPAAALLADGAVLLAWTSEGATDGADRSGTAVRVMRLPLEQVVFRP